MRQGHLKKYPLLGECFLQGITFAPEELSILRLQPAGIPERFMDHPFQLSIYASEFISRPFFDGFHGFCIYPQYERFLFSHPDIPFELLVQRTCIDYRFYVLIAAKHYQQVADHGSFLFLIEFNKFFG